MSKENLESGLLVRLMNLLAHSRKANALPYANPLAELFF
jgi:hypothetical protein